MNYKSIADLNADIKKFLPQLPLVDLIVGIPRDGLMAAMMISFYLNLPVTDIDGLLGRRLLATGHRFKDRNRVDFNNCRILAIDDSIASGKSIAEVKEKLKDIPNITYAVMYTSAKNRNLANLIFQVVEEPRIFEWNLADSYFLTKACVDMDGVLCRDPSKSEQETNDKYLHFLQTTQVIMRPLREIKSIVTARDEKYRVITQAWLAKHGIRYKGLVMRPSNIKSHSAFKAREFRKSGAILFIENREDQAREIFRLARKPVLCTAINSLIKDKN